MDKKIIQIIPSEGWFSVYADENGAELKCRLTCWALYNDGDVAGLDVTPDGEGPMDGSGSPGFLRYIHKDGTQF